MRALFLLLLTACGGEAAKTVDPEIAWYGDQEPVVQRVCGNCHLAGGVGPGNFTTYEGFLPYAEIARLYVEEGVMPPPVSDPECHEYAGSDSLNLTAAERERFLAWIDAGAPAGDEADSVGAFEPLLGPLQDTDLILELPVEHTITPDEGGNQYRCFVLDHVPAEDFSVTAFDVRLDNPEVVHHMILFVDPNNDAGEGYGVEPGTTSFDCADPIMESDWEPLHAWAPGMPPTILADDHGLKIEEGEQLVMQMHYFVEDDEPHTDRSAYALRTTTEPVKEILMFPGAMTDFAIPPGDPAYTYEQGWGFDLDFDVAIHGVFPHMHRLGTRYETGIDKADGTTQCIVRGAWDFDHQMSYMFEEPVIVENGDRLYGSCTWDNSADNPEQLHDPPKTITWGEGTDDEMCVFLSYVSISF